MNIPLGVFRLEVSTAFSAAHALRFAASNGRPASVEPVHGHDFHVTATIQGGRLDADGLLLDFHAVERALNEIVMPWRSRHLNEIPPFDRTNPSAENLARHIADRLSAWLETHARESPKHHPLPPASDGPRVACVRITEAVGCAASHVPDDDGPRGHEGGR